jgi:site-specific DNA recombinase
MVENIEGVFAEYERERIRERMMRGRARKAKQGKVVGHGQPPYGYSFANGAFTIVADEAKVIQMIFRWYISGDDAGLRLAPFAIAHRLSIMQVPTPGAARLEYRKHKPGIWAKATVVKILANETYAGTLYYRKHRYSDGLRIGKRDSAEQIAIPVPPIIDRDTWEEAKQRKQKNSALSPRNRIRQYLLSGRITCRCGRHMSGCTNTSRKVPKSYYKCPAREEHHARLEAVRCSQQRLKAPWLDNLVWQFVLDMMGERARFKQHLLDVQRPGDATAQAG